MNRIRTRGAVLTAAIALAAGSTAVATAHAAERSEHHVPNTDLADSFSKVTRNTDWQLTNKLKLNFPTFHAEGIAFTPDHIFLSSVEILEPTVKYPTPVDGYDRTPGKGENNLGLNEILEVLAADTD